MGIQIQELVKDRQGNPLSILNKQFISFSYGGKNIEDFDLIAVFNDRLNKNIYSDFEDVVSENSEVDGQLYWKTKINPNELSFTLATDGISSKQLEEFKLWFSPGIERELIYVENCEEINLIDVEDKIVLLEGRIFHSVYKKLINAKVAGFIALSGTIYDDNDNTDLNINQIRVHDYSLGYIPGVTIRALDGQMLASLTGAKVRLTLIQNQSKRLSQNVICEIKGTKHPEEIIAFTAHYDSVRFSTGAYDNASGTIGILCLLDYFTNKGLHLKLLQVMIIDLSFILVCPINSY